MLHNRVHPSQGGLLYLEHAIIRSNNMSNNTKYLIVESPVHGLEVLLAFVPAATNIKTGAVTSIYILHPDDFPLEISKQGKDDRVCGSCPLRHSLGGACYVTLFQGPRAVYLGWKNSGKRIDDPVDALALCVGQGVRLGAYGDPAHIPAWLATEIMGAAKKWVGYTHAWRNPVVSAVWKGKAMASCDTVAQLRMAESQGWAGFVASPEKVQGAKTCLNESRGIQCIDCMKCDGAHGSVVITPHGARMKNHPSMKTTTVTKFKKK